MPMVNKDNCWHKIHIGKFQYLSCSQNKSQHEIDTHRIFCKKPMINVELGRKRCGKEHMDAPSFCKGRAKHLRNK